MSTRPVTILLPDYGPMRVPACEESAYTLFASGVPFKIERAESVEGIDYAAFVCPGMFVGSFNLPAPEGKPWPLSMMFSGFRWPGGGMSEWGSAVPYVGAVDFVFRVKNTTGESLPFQIRLVGLELVK